MVYPRICMRMFIWGVAHMVDPWVCMRMFMCVGGFACVHISSCIWGHEVTVYLIFLGLSLNLNFTCPCFPITRIIGLRH